MWPRSAAGPAWRRRGIAVASKMEPRAFASADSGRAAALPLFRPRRHRRLQGWIRFVLGAVPLVVHKSARRLGEAALRADAAASLLQPLMRHARPLVWRGPLRPNPPRAWAAACFWQTRPDPTRTQSRCFEGAEDAMGTRPPGRSVDRDCPGDRGEETGNVLCSGGILTRMRHGCGKAASVSPGCYSSSTAYSPRWSDGYIFGFDGDGLSNASPASTTLHSSETKM